MSFNSVNNFGQVNSPLPKCISRQPIESSARPLQIELLNPVGKVASLNALQRIHQLRDVAAVAEETPLEESVPCLPPQRSVAMHGRHVEHLQVSVSLVPAAFWCERQLQVQVTPRLADTPRHQSARARQVVCNEK